MRGATGLCNSPGITSYKAAELFRNSLPAFLRLLLGPDGLGVGHQQFPDLIGRSDKAVDELISSEMLQCFKIRFLFVSAEEGEPAPLCFAMLRRSFKGAGPLTHIVGNLALAQVAGLRAEMNRLAWRLPLP